MDISTKKIKELHNQIINLIENKNLENTDEVTVFSMVLITKLFKAQWQPYNVGDFLQTIQNEYMKIYEKHEKLNE